MQLNMQKNALNSLLKSGILRVEIFVQKNMDDNFNLLKLKLDLVYRDLSLEAAAKTFDSIKLKEQAPQAPPEPKAVLPDKK